MAYDGDQFFSGVADYVKIDTVDIGGVGSDVTVSYSVETEDLTCGQTRTPVSTAEKTKKYTVAFQAAEFNLANLAQALGQPAANLTGSTYLLMTSDAADSVALEVKINNTNAGISYTCNFPNCKIAASGNVGFPFSAQGFMDMTFDVFADTGVNIGSIIVADIA